MLLLTLSAAAAISIVPYLHSELLPQFREGHFVLQMAMASPGTSVDDVVAVGERITKALLKLPFVDTVAHQIGRAELGEDTWSPDRSEFHIELKPNHTESEEDAQASFAIRCALFPKSEAETLTFLGDRISESLSGETAQVVINAIGNNLVVARKAAAEIQKRRREHSRRHRSSHATKRHGADYFRQAQSGRACKLRPDAACTLSMRCKRRLPGRRSARLITVRERSMSSSFYRPMRATASVSLKN